MKFTSDKPTHRFDRIDIIMVLYTAEFDAGNPEDIEVQISYSQEGLRKSSKISFQQYANKKSGEQTIEFETHEGVRPWIDLRNAAEVEITSSGKGEYEFSMYFDIKK